MVGVAGKSQACNTCRKRRVKCDQTRPSCLKCTTSKRACTGYDRELIFVNRTPSSRSSTATSVLSERKAQQQLEDALGNPKAERDLHHLFSKSPQDSHAFRKYAVELLEATYLPKQPVSSSSNAETSEGSFSWAHRLRDLIEPSRSLDTSIFAFCLTQLHITGTSKASLYECLDQYNTALQHLYSDLEDPERRFKEETLASILVLSTCEFFVTPTGNGLSVHARGIAEILRLRGPGMASTPAWRHLFSRLRVVCTLEALTTRQTRFLENDVWRQIETEFGFNDTIDEAFRIFGGIPAVLERATTLSSISDQGILLKESAAVARSILAMVKSVEMWCDKNWKASPTPRSWPVLSRAANPADIDPSNKIFPFCFEFESPTVAVPIVMSWAVTAQMYSNIIQIHNLVQARIGRPMELEDLLALADANGVDTTNTSEASTQNPLLLTVKKGRSIHEIRSEGTKMVHYVCQSMEYYHRVEMGTYGCQATTYPTWSARQYFRLHPGHEREWSWLQNMHRMKGPGTRWGLSTMAFADIAEPLGGLST